MTQELRTQRDDIMHARDLIDSRRRFTEAVLAGASAGVIGVDGDGRDQHPQPVGRKADRAAAKAKRSGSRSTEVLPELAACSTAARSGRSG